MGFDARLTAAAIKMGEFNGMPGFDDARREYYEIFEEIAAEKRYDILAWELPIDHIMEWEDENEMDYVYWMLFELRKMVEIIIKYDESRKNELMRHYENCHKHVKELGGR